MRRIVSDNTAVQDKRDSGGLRNTIYDQQTRSGRKLTPARLWLYRRAAPVVVAAVRMLWATCRVVRVVGAEHVDEALSRASSFIPVYWHQHQLFCSKYVLELSARGVKPGILVSPSVDGEFGVLVVRRLGAVVIRGSSSHTGARTLRDFYQALVQDGVSPVITPDGPKGPPWEFKPGAILLAQLSQRPIIPFSYHASRAWKISWDRFVIPSFGARVTIAVGAPVYVPKGLDAAAVERIQREMEQTLKQLFDTARSAANQTR
jgi:lysophospholipid acyltransferase (LPLAT)-like uncharacterized protein